MWSVTSVLPRARTYQVRTYGCQMNVHDSERIKGMLEAAGMGEAESEEQANVLVFNTCTIREKADDRLVQRLHNATNRTADDPDLLKNRPILDRAIVISAGVIANMLFATAILFAQVNLSGVIEQSFKPGVLVPSLVDGATAAREAGVKAGDLILAIDDVQVPATSASVSVVADYIKGHAEKTVTLSVQRGDDLVKLNVVPQISKGNIYTYILVFN